MRYRVLFAFALAACACPASQAEDSSFGTACGTKLVVGCQPFHFTGANCHYLMTHAADEGSRSHADEVLAAAHSMGITCIRTWAFGEKGTWNVLQPSPGDYDYHVFEGLDYVLDRCGQLGIRVILTLVNSCDDYGGMQQYVDWDGGGAHDDFYTRPNCKEWYRNHVLKVLTRVNSVNGRTYKDDPTILAWELANEARARTAGLAVLNAWMQEMSGYIKSIDSNHLVSSGIEGFYADAQKNPTPDMALNGTDFISTHQIPSIDIASGHSYPDRWDIDYATAMAFAQQMITDAHTVLGKPFILGEFGRLRIRGDRDEYFQGYYGLVTQDRAAGSCAWMLADNSWGPYDDGFSVYYPGDAATVAIIAQNASDMQALAAAEGPSAAEIRDSGPGTLFCSSAPLVASAVFPGEFYVQQEDRAAAIRVVSDSAPRAGDRVRVGGLVCDDSLGRCLQARCWSIVSGGEPPRPLFVRNSSLCGTPPAGIGGPSSPGAYNGGLLVRVAGRVVSGDGFFALDDGTGAPVRVTGGAAPAGSIALVTGIAGYDASGARSVRPRSEADIVLL